MNGERARATASCALPMIATWCLCFWRIGERQLWRDEGSTWWAAQLPAGDFRRLLEHQDAVLAPYYAFMRLWIQLFGDSEAALRAPSAIAMGLCAGVVVRLGTHLANRAAGLRAGLIFALLPAVSHYGQEARPYALATLFAALSTLLLLRLRERPESSGRAVAYALSVIALALTHLLALMLLAAHAAGFVRFSRARPFVHVDWRPFRRFAIAAGVAVACMVPLLVIGSRQSGQVPEVELDKVARVSPLMIGLLIAGVIALRWLLSSRQSLVLRVWAVLPPVLLVASHPIVHLFRKRYLIFTLPAWALLIAGVIERLGARWRTGATVLALVALVAAGAKSQLHARTSRARVDSDYRAAAQVVAAEAQPGDVVAFGGSTGRLRHARLALAYELRHGPALADVFVAQSMAATGTFAAIECADPAACLPPEVQRIWLVTSAPKSDLYAGIPPARARLLQDQFVVGDVRSPWRVTVALLTRR